MNKDNVIALSGTVGEDVKFAQDICNQIVTAQIGVLDALITEINANVVDAPNTDDRAIEQYMLKLVNTLYALNAKVDNFSFYEAMSDMKATLAFNAKYSESQLVATSTGAKTTRDNHQQYAENNTVDEKILNLIYSKSVRMLKDKIDGAYELLDVLKRILKHHEQEAFFDKQNRVLLG